MSGIFELITLIVFAGLAVLFLQRSVGPETPGDRIYHYAPPAVGCMLANWLGDGHYYAAAIAVILAVVLYIVYLLKPFH